MSRRRTVVGIVLLLALAVIGGAVTLVLANRGPGPDEDPAYKRSAVTHFEDRPQQYRTSWWDQAMALYDAPLTLKYTGLDPTARYRVRVVYGNGPLKLVAGGGHTVHDGVHRKFEVLRFDVPPAATAGGELTLTWTRTADALGPGREGVTR